MYSNSVANSPHPLDYSDHSFHQQDNSVYNLLRKMNDSQNPFLGYEPKKKNLKYLLLQE